MRDRSRFILLAVSYLFVMAFGVWLLTLPILLTLLVGSVRGQAAVMTAGFGMIAVAALGLVSVVRKF